MVHVFIQPDGTQGLLLLTTNWLSDTINCSLLFINVNHSVSKVRICGMVLA